MSETYGQALARAWRESECAEEPTAEESYGTCRHADACKRLWRRSGDDRQPWEWCGCEGCFEWEETR